jgi:hypothetical protein
MMPKLQLIIYPEEDEAIVRRLGAAIVVLWDELSEENQKVILRQAGLVNDREPIIELDQRIKAFIREHSLGPKGRPLDLDDLDEE